MLDLRAPPAHVPSSALFDFDIEHDPRLKGEPHRGVGQLQYETPELFYSARHGGNWIARGHDVIHAVMQDPERFFSGGFKHKLLPIHANPPEHAFYRKVLLTAFSPKVVGALLPLIEQLAGDLIDAVVPAGECEFVAAVAEPLPVTVFMNMLGIPLSLMAPVRKLVIAALRTSDPAVRAALFNEQLELFDPIIQHHLDAPQDDMLGIIIRSEIDGRVPDFEELRGYLLLLANAGLDTVVNAMTFAIKHLAEDLELQRKLRADPEQVPLAVEEFLRLYAPSTISRYATRDTTLHGQTIKAGERIILLLPAGNLDAAVFAEPFTVQLDRQTPTLTFGTGVHRCLGSHLARIEMRVVITQCLARLPEFRLDGGGGGRNLCWHGLRDRRAWSALDAPRLTPATGREFQLSIEQFRISVGQDRLDRIAAKLADARIGPAPTDEAGWALGMSAGYLAELVEFWRTDYDWRAEEAALNRYPQYLATIDGLPIHFQHIATPGGYPVPIVLTHGWPGSIVEFQAVIPRLVEAGFSVVVPSLPGYGWSGRPANPVGPAYTAGLWRKLMVDVLGYPRFFAQGGDWGSMVTSWLAANHAHVVPAIHLNLFRTVLPGPDAAAPLKDYWARVGNVMASESAYQQLHQTRPQTIGLALHDNPVGWAAWVIEKFQRWSDSNGHIESRFTKGQLITNLMTYLTTDSVMSSIWFYYGNTRESQLPLPLKVPTGLAAYPGEFLPVPNRDLAQLAYNVQHYATMAAGGHFAAMEVPDIFAADILAFFTPLAGNTTGA